MCRIKKRNKRGERVFGTRKRRTQHNRGEEVKVFALRFFLGRTRLTRRGSTRKTKRIGSTRRGGVRREGCAEKKEKDCGKKGTVLGRKKRRTKTTSKKGEEPLKTE